MVMAEMFTAAILSTEVDLLSVKDFYLFIY